MTSVSARRGRLLRLRTIEHRVAMAKLANADATLVNLERVAERLERLKADLCTNEGGTNGLALKSMAEMSFRLDAATTNIAVPINEAEVRRTEYNELRIKARQKEEGAAKLHDRAIAGEELVRVRRADTNRPFRKPVNLLDRSI